MAETSPNDLLRHALGHEAGSEEWLRAVTAALRQAKGGRGRGRPPRGKRPLLDAFKGKSGELEMTVMAEVMEDTGEHRPYALARLAVATGKIPLSVDKKSVIRRLAMEWKLLMAD